MKSTLILCITLMSSLSAAAKINCSYAEVKSPSYVISERFKKYAAMNFFTEKETQSTQRASLDNSKLKGLLDTEFKVINTGVETTLQTYWVSGSNKYTDVSIGNELYVLDKSLSTKIITPNCDVFYMSSADAFSPRSFNMGFKRSDGVEMSDSDYLVLNEKNLNVKDIDAVVSYDHFEKLVNIKTKEFDGMLLRGSYNPTNKQVILTQLYLNTTFYGSWGNINVAYDLNGKSHEVVAIDHSADCSSRSTDCQLNETLGVTLSEDFLRNNQNGFELKLKGKQDKIVKVTPNMVHSYLNGIEKAKSILN